MKTISFNISDDAFELLKKINDSGFAEYRDTQYNSIEDFKDSDEFKNGFMSVESFLKRNSDGTHHLINELLQFNLVDIDDMCWHITYILTDFGKFVISKES
jgi:hypothetical protein